MVNATLPGFRSKMQQVVSLHSSQRTTPAVHAVNTGLMLHAHTSSVTSWLLKWTASRPSCSSK
jgi:hypothetical protein